MTVYVGNQVQCRRGDWESTPNAYLYQWQVSDSGISGWENISGSTRSDLILGYDLAGKYVRCQVVALNVAGASSATVSAGQLVVQGEPPPSYTTNRVVLISGVKSTTSDAADDVRDVDKGWSNWV